MGPLHRRLGEARFAPLTIEREQELAAAWHAASDESERRAIRNELIERHLRLVVYIGRGYEHRLAREEIMSVGALALTRAAERWEPARGSMYQWARRWITTALTKAVDAQRTIRVPEAVANGAAMIAKRIEAIEAELGRALSQDERDEVAAGRPTFGTLPQVARSLDQPASDANEPRSSGLAVSDLIADPNVLDPHEAVEVSERNLALEEALAELDPVELDVLRARFALNGQARQTLAALSQQHGVSAEAMRRIEIAALAKLRHPALKTDLTGLL